MVRRPPVDLVLLGVLVLGSLCLGRFLLDAIPANLTADEADNLLSVLRLRATGLPTFDGFSWDGNPASSIYVYRAFAAVLGDVAGLRMSAVAFGAATLVPFYLVARRLTAPRPALLAALLLATSMWFLTFTRTGWPNVQAACYLMLTVYALERAMAKAQWWWSAACGVCASLGFFAYFAGFLVAPAVAVCLVGALAAGRGRRQPLLVGLGLVLLAVACAAWLQREPLLNLLTPSNRANTISIFSLQDAPPALLAKNAVATVLVLGLNLQGVIDDGGRYGVNGGAVFDTVTGVLIQAGLLVALGSLPLPFTRWRRTIDRLSLPKRSWWWLAMLGLLLAGTQLFAENAPNRSRGFIVLPLCYLLVAIGLHTLWDGMRRVAQQRWPSRAGVAGGAALVLLAIGVAGANVLAYFAWVQSPVALADRQPALEFAEYPEWVAAQRAFFARNPDGIGLSVLDWRAMDPQRYLEPVSPDAGAQTSGDVVLRWRDLRGIDALSDEVQLARDGANWAAAGEPQVAPARSTRLTGLAAGAWYWRVRPHALSGQEPYPWSRIASFVVER